MATEAQETIDDTLLAEALAILDDAIEDPDTEPDAGPDALPSDDEEFAVAQGDRS